MLLWLLAKLDIKKSISTIFCIKKKKEEEATQLVHLHCYKKQQYNSFGTATTEERDDFWFFFVDPRWPPLQIKKSFTCATYMIL
jgi:hypothetical protein